jgi:hypothetical protein
MPCLCQVLEAKTQMDYLALMAQWEAERNTLMRSLEFHLCGMVQSIESGLVVVLVIFITSPPMDPLIRGVESI